MWFVSLLLACAAGAGSLVLIWYKQMDARRRVANAMAAEINSHREIVREKKLLEKFKAIKARLEAGEDVPFPEMKLDSTELDPLYQKHLGELGALGTDLAARVNHAYHQLRGMRASMNLVTKVPPPPVPVKLVCITEAISYIERAIELADPLLIDLKRVGRSDIDVTRICWQAIRERWNRLRD